MTRDQIRHGLGLDQVQLAVQKGALGKFARPGQPRAQGDDLVQQQGQQHPAAVHLAFQQILAGVGGRGLEIDHDPAINEFARFGF